MIYSLNLYFILFLFLGTTGPPKAVMISHDNITWTTKVLMDNYMDLNHQDRIVSYLPLSHIAAQVLYYILFVLVCVSHCQFVCTCACLHTFIFYFYFFYIYFFSCAQFS